MNNSILKHRTLFLALAFTGFIFTSNMASAEQALEEIIVSAPIEREKTKRTTGPTITTETIELNRSVSLAGLDLTKYADVSELDARIAAVAEESCQKLSAMFPLDDSNPKASARCVKSAIASAEELKSKAIAAAHSESQ